MQIIEVVMDLGRIPLIRFPEGDIEASPHPITEQDLAQAIAKVGSFGVDNRAGINATLHRISCIRNREDKIIGLTCRVGRAVPGVRPCPAHLAALGMLYTSAGHKVIGETIRVQVARR
jgi:stage III sporulation protein SpoIIIAA